MENVYSLLLNMLPDIAAVVIGGIVTLYITNLTNVNLLKREHELEMLQKIKTLLNDWTADLMMNVDKNLKITTPSEFKASPKSEELKILISYFNLNTSLLSNFKDKFKRIRRLELDLQFQQGEYIKRLAEVSEEHDGEADSNYFSKNPDKIKVLEEYASVILSITDEINDLITSIDEYISIELLKI